MDDSIDRQAAIDAVANMLRRHFGVGGGLAKTTLEDLPSAQKKGHWIDEETNHAARREG